MKMFLLAAALAALVAGPAPGADLRAPAPVNKAPPPPAPVYRWSGCYAGATAGYSDHHATFNEHGQYSWNGWSNGFIGGGELGCNFQSDSFVYGIEGDFSGLTNKGHFDGGDHGLFNWKMNWLATVRLRSGLTVGKTLLFLTYIRIGYEGRLGRRGGVCAGIDRQRERQVRGALRRPWQSRFV
jgi:outer membrane immunogenic protein